MFCLHGEMLLGKILLCFRSLVKKSAFPELEVWTFWYKCYFMDSGLHFQGYWTLKNDFKRFCTCVRGEMLLGKILLCFRRLVKKSAFPELEV